MLKNSLLQQLNTGFDPKVKGVYFQGSPVKFFSQASEFPPQLPLFFFSLFSLLSSSSLPHPTLKCYFNMTDLLRVSLRWIHQNGLQKKLTEWKVHITNRGTGKIFKKDALSSGGLLVESAGYSFPVARTVRTLNGLLRMSTQTLDASRQARWEVLGGLAVTEMWGKENLKCTVRKDGAFQKHGDTNSSFANAFLTWDKGATYPNRTKITQKK